MVQTFFSHLNYFNSEKNKTEQERKAYFDEWKREESRYHVINATRVLHSAQLAKGSDESKGIQEEYNKRLKQLGQEIEDLKAKQKAVKDTIDPNLNQHKIFNDLKRLLQLKMDLAAGQSRGSKEDKGFKVTLNKKLHFFIPFNRTDQLTEWSFKSTSN